MKKLPRVLALVGPTASGKTPLSILLAERLDGEIVSADSRQVYKRLDKGTAKPSKEDLRRVPHHFVDVLALEDDYNAGQFGKDARAVVHDIVRRGRVPIVVGGSGLYVRALIDGLFEGPGKDSELREILESRLEHEGASALLEVLRTVDPLLAAGMDATKPRRVIRALEVYYLTGKPLSEFHKEQRREPTFDCVQVGLECERKTLYGRIENRVDEMMRNGLLQEVESLKRHGYTTHINALNTVGYKEMFDFLDGRNSLDESVALMKQNTRRFAKRQLTWFRADKRIRWVSMVDERKPEAIADEVSKIWEGN